jgi:hypothetical protein
LRGQVNVAFRSAADAPYGAFGADVQFRGQHTKFAASDWTASVPTSNLFWTPNSMLRIDLGNGGQGGYGTLGGIDRNLGIRDAEGLKIELLPIPGFSLVAHAFYGKADKLFEDMNFALGAKYTASGLLAAVANFRLYPEIKDYTKLEFGAGANFLALSGIGLSALAADVAAYDFGSDNSFIGIGERVAFATGALSLGARARQFIWMGKDSKDFIPMMFRGEISYKVTSTATVGVEGQYAMGTKPSFNFRNASEVGGLGAAANFDQKDDVALGISPRLTLNLGPELVLGYNLQMDMSEGASNAGTSKKMQHLIYGIVNISF